MALSGHHTSLGDNRGCAEAVLLGAQDGGDENIPAGLEATVHAQDHAAAQVIAYERLLGLGKSQFPWRPRVLDGPQRRSPRSPVVSADVDDVGISLGHAGGDGPHAGQ